MQYLTYIIWLNILLKLLNTNSKNDLIDFHIFTFDWRNQKFDLIAIMLLSWLSSFSLAELDIHTVQQSLRNSSKFKHKN